MDEVPERRPSTSRRRSCPDVPVNCTNRGFDTRSLTLSTPCFTVPTPLCTRPPTASMASSTPRPTFRTVSTSREGSRGLSAPASPMATEGGQLLRRTPIPAVTFLSFPFQFLANLGPLCCGRGWWVGCNVVPRGPAPYGSSIQGQQHRDAAVTCPCASPKWFFVCQHVEWWSQFSSR